MQVIYILFMKEKHPIHGYYRDEFIVTSINMKDIDKLIEGIIENGKGLVSREDFRIVECDIFHGVSLEDFKTWIESNELEGMKLRLGQGLYYEYR